MNRLIDLSCALPAPDPVLTMAYTPIGLELPGRQPLELRLTAPAAGNALPIVILSHGFGPSNYIPSKDGYAPLAQFWAERGIAVIQPTHASSRVGGLDPTSPGGPYFWRERVVEMREIMDRLDEIERQGPGRRRTAGPRPDRRGGPLLRGPHLQPSAWRASAGRGFLGSAHPRRHPAGDSGAWRCRAYAGACRALSLLRRGLQRH
jgi:hypothetical protein